MDAFSSRCRGRLCPPRSGSGSSGGTSVAQGGPRRRRLSAGMPFVTLFLLLVMASVVAGVVEETAFRGYMQLPIERRHGPVAAILLNGVVFGFAHMAHHPAGVFVMLPY